MIQIGDWFELSEEGLEGYVESIECDAFGEPAAAVIALTSGKWACVDLSAIEAVSVTLH